MSNLNIGPLQFAGSFEYYRDGSNRPVVHMDPYVFDLGIGSDVVVFAGLETQFNTPEQFSNIALHMFGWVDGQFVNMTDQWFPNGINQIEGTGEVVVGDFNGDGLIDMFTTAYADMSHHVNAYAFMNKGGYFHRVNLGLYEGWQHGAAAADINKDGYTDVYAVGYGESTTLLMGGVAGLSPVSTIGNHGGGSGVVFGDFMNNGTVTAVVVDTPGALSKKNDTMLFGFDLHDLVKSNSVSFVPLSILPQPIIETSHPEIGSHDVRVKAVDFNFDGLLDVVVFSAPSRSHADGPKGVVQFLKNQGNGNFKDVTENYLMGFNNKGMIPYAPQIKDFNRDGFFDIYMDGPTYAEQRMSSALISQKSDGVFYELFRSEFSSLSPQDGSMGTLLFGPEGNVFYVLLSSDWAANRPAIVSIAKVDFIDRLQSEKLVGTKANDTIWGMGGNNIFYASPGDDILIGAGGIDAVVFSKSKDKFDIATTVFFDPKVNQYVEGVQIKDKDGLYGVNSIASIERIIFSDQALGLDIMGNAGQAYRIYKAAFDRAPDDKGLGYWINDLDQGASIKDVAGGFMASAEFEGLYGANPSDQAFISLLYNNVLGRELDQPGFEYWMQDIARGETRASLLVNFSESQENQDNVAELIGNGVVYLPWGE